MPKAWSTIFNKLLQVIRTLSLDVLAGAFCGYTFARLVLGCDCPAATPFVLCATIWLIYTLDHLLDARIRKEHSARPVYRWHWEHRKLLWPLLLTAATGTAIVSLICLPVRVLAFGCLTAGMVILYTMAHHGMFGLRIRYIFKECWVSIVYTAGIWGVPLLYYGKIPGLPVLAIVLVYWLLVLINVLIYSYHEYHTDLNESQFTLATVTGRKVTLLLLRLLMLCVLVLIIVTLLLIDAAKLQNACFIMAGMAAGMLLILSFPGFFHQHERYGLLADGVFLLPGLIYWIV